MKAASTVSCLAAIIVASYCGGGECAGIGSLSVPTAFVHSQQRQTIGGATAATVATTKSAPALVTLFDSKNEGGDIGGDEGRRPEEELIGEGKPIELESLRGQQSSSFMGLEPLSEGEDPFDNGVPLVTGTIVLFVSTWLTLAPFFMGLDAPDLPPPPGM
jgi:hypothetical protein